MKHQNWPLTTHLAILQQYEYDLALYETWLRSKHVLSEEKLRLLKPETMTLKLKLISLKAQLLGLFVPRHTAVKWATLSLLPLENTARTWLMWKAKAHLRRLQSQGLMVIGVAGSYGKTSVKHELHHFLSLNHHTYMSPASYNTPLGLASSILKLTSDHDLFIAELGEYKPGDIDELLCFLKPNIGVLTPIGYAHDERFGSFERMVGTFSELWQSSCAPELLIIDDKNREYVDGAPSHAIWYGSDKESDLQLKDVEIHLQGGKALLTFSDGTKRVITTNLTEETQLRNALPAFLIEQSFHRPIDALVKALQFVPAIPRRLELHANPNGTFVIDNSYNSNPGSWESVLPTLTSLHKSGLVILTPGFVELGEELSNKEHAQMAEDLIALKATVGVIRTRFNSALVKKLSKHLPKESFLIGDSYADLLEQLSSRAIPLTYLWMEGGVREIYQ